MKKWMWALAVLATVAVSRAAISGAIDYCDDTVAGTFETYLGVAIHVGSTSYDMTDFYWLSSGDVETGAGTVYVFSAPYTGTPDGLSSATTNLVGSASWDTDSYDFGSGLTLDSGTSDTFYAYCDTAVTTSYTNYTGAGFTGDASSWAADGSTAFAELAGGGPPYWRYAAVPEPGSFALLGLGSLLFVARRRKRD